MKKSFVLTPRAEQDIEDIWDYITADSIEARRDHSGNFVR